jgi:hypothetical protein
MPLALFKGSRSALRQALVLYYLESFVLSGERALKVLIFPTALDGRGEGRHGWR